MNGKYRALSEAPKLHAWTSLIQWGETDAVALVRSRSGADDVPAMLNAAVARVSPEVRAFHTGTLEECISPAFLLLRTASVLLTALGAVALCLSLLGIYGVIAFTCIARCHHWQRTVAHYNWPDQEARRRRPSRPPLDTDTGNRCVLSLCPRPRRTIHVLERRHRGTSLGGQSQERIFGPRTRLWFCRLPLVAG